MLFCAGLGVSHSLAPVDLVQVVGNKSQGPECSQANIDVVDAVASSNFSLEQLRVEDGSQ